MGMVESKVINIYGGPGVGKSTTAAHIFYTLKSMGKSTELVTEFAKELVWHHMGIDPKNPTYLSAELSDQLFIFAHQHRRILRLYGQVEYIVTDSPLINSALYCPDEYPKEFTDLVIAMDRRFVQYNFFLERDPNMIYEELGRVHLLEEAAQKDVELKKIMSSAGIDYTTLENNEYTLDSIISSITDSDRSSQWTQC